MDYIITSFEVVLENEDNYMLLNYQISFIQRLVRGCWQFIENVLRKDAFLLHNSIAAPLPYNVDIKLIEYFYTIFYKTVKCLDYVDKGFEHNRNNSLTKNEKRLSENTFCLIVPKVCRRIKTHVHHESIMDTLLIIDLPISVIYEPTIAIESIVHETIHGWGDFFRCRSERIKYFCKCLSVVLADKLGMYSNKVIKYLEKNLLRDCNDDLMRLDDLCEYVIDLVPSYILEDKTMTDLTSIYLKDLAEENGKKIEISFFKRANIEVEKIVLLSKEFLKTQEYYNSIRDISHFFKECYADLIMIKLLGLSTPQYIRMFWPEINNVSMVDNNVKLLIQRIIMVIIVAFGNGEKIYDEANNMNGLDFFYKEANSLYDIINKAQKNQEEPELDNAYYNIDASLIIINYLKSCLNNFDSTLKNSQTIVLYNDLKDCFSCIIKNDRIFGKDFYSHLSDGRKAMFQSDSSNS